LERNIPGWQGPLDMAIIFEWLAQDSMLAAELANEQTQRQVWLRLALMWAAAAREGCDDGATERRRRRVAAPALRKDTQRPRRRAA
jgi:hypothetical protein